MWRNAPELLWDGPFITGIYPWISWENGSAFCADTRRRQSLTGLLPQGALLSSSFTQISPKFVFNNGRKWGPTKMERNCCDRKAWTRIFPLAFPNKDCVEVHVDRPTRISWALAFFIAHICKISKFNPLENAQIFLCCKESNAEVLCDQNYQWGCLFSEFSLMCENCNHLLSLQEQDGQKT